jgi:hypothetical protein
MSPNGGETWTIGESHDITWSSGGVTDVHVELSRDSGSSWETLVASVPAVDESFGWAVSGPASPSCLVQLTDAADDDPVGVSAATFSIADPADGGEAAGVGERLGSGASFAWLLLGGLPLLRRRRGRGAA